MVLTCNSSSPISTVWPSAVSNKSGETPHYDVRPLLACEELETTEHMEEQTPHAKIGACVHFRGDWCRKVMGQWIEYHRLIGIQHFWIYVNEPWDNLRHLPQRPYVTYVPYDYNDYWDAHVAAEGHFNPGPHFMQEPFQMQCLYRAKKNKLDWVTTTDVDEYIRVLSPHSTTPNNITVSPLQHLLDSIANGHEIGGLIMNSIPFGSNQLMNKTNTTLVLDHVWRNQLNPENVKWGRWKLIYKPQNVWDVGIHYVHMGGQTQRLNVASQAYIQHYKNADNGVFQSIPEELVMDTELRDQYRDRVLVAMNSKSPGV
jgi:hypothetical protein